MLSNVDYHITDVCNLKCVCCNHFCPLVPANTPHKSLNQITKDMLALSKFKDIVPQISILGGEPTLHPELTTILKLIRCIFPSANLLLVTNGTNWKKFEEWKEVIWENNIKIYISSYPYCEDYEQRNHHIIDVIGAEYCTYDDSYRLQHGPLVLTPKYTEDDCHHCRMRGYCCQLKDEKLYLCNYAAQINYLFDAFPITRKYIELDGKEYVDLTDPNLTIDDIGYMVYGSFPSICKYCMEGTRWEDHNMVFVDWKRSDRKMEEWVN